MHCGAVPTADETGSISAPRAEWAVGPDHVADFAWLSSIKMSTNGQGLVESTYVYLVSNRLATYTPT